MISSWDFKNAGRSNAAKTRPTSTYTVSFIKKKNDSLSVPLAIHDTLASDKDPKMSIQEFENTADSFPSYTQYLRER